MFKYFNNTHLQKKKEKEKTTSEAKQQEIKKCEEELQKTE